MSHFVFLINRLLSKVLCNKTTPFGILQNKTLDLSILKVFGCEYFVSTHLAQITKLDLRAKKRVYLGHKPSTKGYLVYEIKSRE